MNLKPLLLFKYLPNGFIWQNQLPREITLKLLFPMTIRGYSQPNYFLPQFPTN